MMPRLSWILALCLVSQGLFAYGTSASSSGVAVPTPFQTPTTAPHGHSQQSPQGPQPPKHQPPRTPITLNSVYKNPGVASLQEGNWVGSANLYNLHNRLGLYVEVVAPEGSKLLDEAAIKQVVQAQFAQKGLSVREGDIPLPFFHVLVMVQPIENQGYAVYCSGRLFEKVEVDRIHLERTVLFQAITWEGQELLVAPANQLSPLVMQTVAAIAASFVEIYQNQKTGH